MKILKIALQNINSLKSDTPIVIDFQNDHFKDVGLYAITGVTGAGKTTILDAITIALYHNVPRFNQTKGTLLDVVSFNANDAFCSVTFENNNIIYEGYWGIRLANKTGIPLKNPIEKVSLKNLTEEKTLADQKRKYIEEVEKVTQLDYTQFLRSVLLAQGDFASFLTAKGPDKGKLLEQITGEGIYKAIGQQILERKSKEENTLKDLESTINAADTIKEEERIALNEQKEDNNKKITALEVELKLAHKIADWYLKNEKLTKEGADIEKNSKSIADFKEKHQKNLDLLALDEKATPFKDILQNIARIENSSKEKNTQITALTKELQLLHPVILKLETADKTLTNDFKKAEKDISDWQPKFDAILKIETDIKHQQETLSKNKTEIANLEKVINTFSLQEKNIAASIEQNTTALKSVETYTNEHKNLAAVDRQISNWTTDLITLKNKKTTLIDNEKIVVSKNSIVKKSLMALDTHTKAITKEEKEVSDFENQLQSISESLKKQNITDLIHQKDTLIKNENNWKTLQQYSEDFNNLVKEKNTLITTEETISRNFYLYKKVLSSTHKKIVNQEKLVADATRILNLERSIKNYEADRLKLIEGEACVLCGATEHPFVIHGKEVNISKSEIDLKNRQDILLALTNTKNKLEKNIGIAKSKLETLTTQINTNKEQLSVINTKANILQLNCNLSDISIINDQLKGYTSAIPKLDLQLKETQNLQLQKEKLNITIKNKKESLTAIKIQIAQLNEAIKHDKEEIQSKETLISQTKEICTLLGNDLKTRLAVFKYELPTIENTQEFINDIENDILLFNKKTKELVALKGNEDQLKIELKNIQKNKLSETKELNNLNKEFVLTNKKITTEKAKRNLILPERISVTTKREELQLIEKKLSNSIKENKKQLQRQLDLKTEKETLIEKNKVELLKQKSELEPLHITFNQQLKNSNFDSKESVISALLKQEDKVIIAKNKERINKNIIQINTLKEAFKKNTEHLLKQKKFTITEDENKLNLVALQLKQKEIIASSGGIAERFRKDLEIRNRNKEIYVKIDKQSEVFTTWKQLYFLIGSSKDAFNVYVQRITLQNLLKLANIHLYSLNKRYSLKMQPAYKKGEELNFSLIDHYQTNQSRLVDTCSGGEKFIISLALALGLSDLASKNVKIDSLFIDEGFGTLDNSSLETVIATLETLQSQGKVIGIISHVENLKERIPTQIQISKRSNGISVVDIV